jgi:DNA invertase Pin-like site-specific DNA recombinase
MGANGLRLVSAGRKSRKGDEGSQFDRQEARNKERAERDGHAIVHTTRDVVSSQTMPWDRRELKAWMTDPANLALYDGILVETDRLARCDDKGWHYIEHWCYENEKVIVTTEGVQFPARDDSDRYQWIGLKRRARTYWEDVRDKHAQTRELVKANGGAIGVAPLGYVITGPKMHKTFEIDPVFGPVVVEAFTKISKGATVISVCVWLSGILGRNVRNKFVVDMIQRGTYLGQRDHFTFDALITQELFDSANAALAARRFTKKPGGRAIAHGYSGLVFCECGAPYYHHQSTKDGKATGKAKYRCGMGRRGNAEEARCEFGAPLFVNVDQAVDRLMARMTMAERIMTTTGGDHARQTALSAIQDQMNAAMSAKDMASVVKLAAEFEVMNSKESAPIEISVTETGRTYGEVWAAGTLAERRNLLERGEYRLVVKYTDDEWRVFLEPTEAGREAFRMFRTREWKISMSEAVE